MFKVFNSDDDLKSRFYVFQADDNEWKCRFIQLDCVESSTALFNGRVREIEL